MESIWNQPLYPSANLNVVDSVQSQIAISMSSSKVIDPQHSFSINLSVHKNKTPFIIWSLCTLSMDHITSFKFSESALSLFIDGIIINVHSLSLSALHIPWISVTEYKLKWNEMSFEFATNWKWRRSEIRSEWLVFNDCVCTQNEYMFALIVNGRCDHYHYRWNGRWRIDEDIDGMEKDSISIRLDFNSFDFNLNLSPFDFLCFIMIRFIFFLSPNITIFQCRIRNRSLSIDRSIDIVQSLSHCL